MSSLPPIDQKPWSPWTNGPIDRRQFIRTVEAAIAVAGLAGCTLQPPEKVLAYISSPEKIIPGKPTYYATTMPLNGYGLGVLGECQMGRPLKIDGNPQSPSTRGKSNVFMQASVLSLYDPDRSRRPTLGGEARSWSDALAAIKARLGKPGTGRGRGVRILTEAVTSPSLTAELRAFTAAYPEARWVRFDPSGDDGARAASRSMFGKVLHPVARLESAQRVLLLDADLFHGELGSIRHAYDFGRGRDIVRGSGALTRLYAVETGPSVSGAVADHRLAVRPSQLTDVALSMTRYVKGEKTIGGESAVWIKAAADDLLAHRGRSIVVAGRGAPATVHACAHVMNEVFGARGQTMAYLPELDEGDGDNGDELAKLCDELETGKVDLLIVLDANPAYHAPGDLNFLQALSHASLSVHFGSYADETAQACQWHLPANHYLESWGDMRAFDGTISFQQPLIRPLYDSRSPSEFLAALRNADETHGLELMRQFWMPRLHEDGFRHAVHDGFVSNSAPASIAIPLNETAVRALLDSVAVVSSTQDLEAVVRLDPTIGDGRFANNAWLQETPKPYLTLTWENAAVFSHTTAARLGIESGDVIRLAHGEKSIEGPALVMPGTPDDTVVLSTGYGRRTGSVAAGSGFDVAPLRTSAAAWSIGPVVLTALKRKSALAMTQRHHRMEGRHPVESCNLADFVKSPDSVHTAVSIGAPRPEETLLPAFPAGDYSWGMGIDLSQCIGCNACVVACQAENNIPVVGKEQVLLEREMHWLRVDRYFEGNALSPSVSFQPVPCMHCEKAPCEVVCPVGATVHDKEGLNEMVYNRCVGTRYCSNNCPYKVRRFNFLAYNPPRQDPRSLAHNPDVTVRERGVMEKCTYCVQRISGARIEADKEGRRIADLEVTPACAAACPTEAIVFGDIKDSNTLVSLFKRQKHDYALLAELNTRPRTTYLAKLRDLNPDVPQVTT